MSNSKDKELHFYSTPAYDETNEIIKITNGVRNRSVLLQLILDHQESSGSDNHVSS